MKKILIILCIFISKEFAYSQKTFIVKGYPLYFTRSRSKYNAESRHFKVKENDFIGDSCIFYESLSLNQNMDFFKDFPDIIYENINFKETKHQDSLILTFLKVKKDSIKSDPQSYLDIIEIFYHSQKQADTIFNRISKKSEIDYPVIPLDWAFYLTKNKSIIVIFSEGYKHDDKLFKVVDMMIKKEVFTIRYKYISDKIVIPKP